MEAMAGDHLNGKQIMREGDKEVSPLLWASAVRVCQYSLSSLYRFLGNALWILLSICVDHFLIQEWVQKWLSIKGPDQKQARDNNNCPLWVIIIKMVPIGCWLRLRLFSKIPSKSFRSEKNEHKSNLTCFQCL